ncbi:regulator of chromosome condensation 1/beta-lactamase-inhibitor protein II [Fimicolochytrium jonesii]|uniref:regulator of chromosome condensation 1/beta-lactamase-inhibitor protein II n=1 Tax=Fimicolochytrium jonesii TaxID=1396493 RepID=UPI0022FDB973|nr:regulator of chromosome condensation 1/beta-lactamase-inhibitor protein II [Fimicolochytrium jonesii]KAI8824049.1 regulator of chromosome condensation 1/beta-lactamase-inhibitor protein II [Fimicolochytrium jonesii]
MPYTEVGEVWVVGSGDCGQLGLGEDILEKERPSRLAYFNDKNIVHVVSGGLHNIAISQDGKLYSWGCNDQMALGRGGQEMEPGPVEGLEDKVIVQVACGDSISVALTNHGDVYCWGTFRGATGIFGFYPGIEIQPRPFKMNTLRKIVSIGAGNNHVACVDNNGMMYSWGNGEQGQLGHRIMERHSRGSQLLPRAISFYPSELAESGARASKKFERVYCGGYSSFFVHETNAVFGYGLNNYGQLGIGARTDPIALPQRVQGYDEASGLRMMAVGEHHSLLLDGTGTVYAFGRGDSGQLGLGDVGETPYNSPTPITSLQPTNIIEISSNSSFNLAISDTVAMDSDNPTEARSNLYSWGYGDMGQLCNEGGGDENTPFLVGLKGRRVIKASAGGQHSVFLIAPRQENA